MVSGFQRIDGASPPEKIKADLRAGIKALDAMGVVPDRARERATLDAWLPRHGREDDAQPLIESARRTYVEPGATRWLDELEVNTAGLGLSPG